LLLDETPVAAEGDAMFPIRDHNPSTKVPYVTYALIATNVLVFLSYWSLFSDDRALLEFYSNWALVPGWASNGQNTYTFLTSTFLHGGFLHLAGNMLFLWIFGDNLEEELGHVGFLLFYLAAGIGANVLHVLSAPDSMVPLVGASGSIAGVMGAYLLIYPRAKVDVLFIFVIFFKVWSIPAWIMLGVWFVLQLVNGAGSDASVGGVAYWAHVGGFLIGLVLALPVWLRRGGPGYWNRNHGQPNHPATEYSATKIPVVRRTRR